MAIFKIYGNQVLATYTEKNYSLKINAKLKIGRTKNKNNLVNYLYF